MTVIPIVQGNLLRLGIALQVVKITSVEGVVDKQVEDFVPNPNFPVKVLLTRGSMVCEFTATMEGNVAVIEDKGTVHVGKYALTVLCRDDDGNPMRFKQKDAVNIVDLTAEAGIVPGAEFETGTQWLDGAVFLSLTAQGGGGIGEETDPIFSASPAAGITAEDINKWDGKQDALTFDNAPTDNSTNMVRSGGIKAYVDNMIARLQRVIDVITHGDDTQDIIDTFNEVVDFLAGIDTDDPTLFNQLKGLDDAITALQRAYDGLATVATSGDYRDLSHKPTIPAEQIQSDWEQSDNTAKDYIKNKPTVTNGKSAYQSYLDTTSDNPVKSESEWVASLKGENGVSLGEISLVQTTGTSDRSVMSQAAVTEAIKDNVSVERGTCVKFGVDAAYAQLNSRQIELLNASTVMSMTFMINGGDNDTGVQDWRYLEVGAYSTNPNVLSFQTTYNGAFYKRGFTGNTQSLTITPSLGQNTLPHPVVGTLVCDREHGTVKYYKGSTLINTDTREEYKVSKFIDDDGVIIFKGGDNGCRFYGLQFYDFDIVRCGYLKEILNNSNTSVVDVNMKKYYSDSHAFVDITDYYERRIYDITTSNGETTITRKDGLAGSFWLTDFNSSYKEIVTEFTINKSFNCAYSWNGGRLLYDSNGILVYDGTVTNNTTTFPAGTYKMVAFWQRYAVGIQTLEDGATLVLHSNKARKVGCIAHFKFDALFNRKVYDDVAQRFYTFYSNTACTTVTDDYSISSLPLRVTHICNLSVPHYVGEIKMVNGTVYIADDTWTWKRINNS